jgi:hypothetical protein
MVVNKTSEDATMISKGSLVLVDVRNPIMHFNFEKVNVLWQSQVWGLRSKHKLRARHVDVHGIILFPTMPSHGEFGEQYYDDAAVGGIELKAGGIQTMQLTSKGKRKQWVFILLDHLWHEMQFRIVLFGSADRAAGW